RASTSNGVNTAARYGAISSEEGGHQRGGEASLRLESEWPEHGRHYEGTRSSQELYNLYSIIDLHHRLKKGEQDNHSGKLPTLYTSGGGLIQLQSIQIHTLSPWDWSTPLPPPQSHSLR
ncbi:hypothetical protein PFISCL1PPCAC_5735, partial [Pristionchus fissidentatus]